jgi:hypothetical protein
MPLLLRRNTRSTVCRLNPPSQDGMFHPSSTKWSTRGVERRLLNWRMARPRRRRSSLPGYPWPGLIGDEGGHPWVKVLICVCAYEKVPICRWSWKLDKIFDKMRPSRTLWVQKWLQGVSLKLKDQKTEFREKKRLKIANMIMGYSAL